MANAMTLIGAITLSSAQTTVTFSNLPQTYQDLYLIGQISMSSTTSASRLRLNGDTGANYYGVWITGTGSSSASSNESGQTGARIVGASVGPTTAQSVLTLTIFDYAQNNKQKSVLSRWGDATAETQATASRWASTSAVTSLTIYDVLGQTYSAGNTFYLYGIAG
jgi:hypothetical protein